MADKRAFAKFDIGYLDNPKMLDVLDASSTAILMHFASVLYCAQHLTDGVVASKAMQRKTGGSADDIRLLIDAGLWHAPGHDCETCQQPPEGKVYVHHFLEHNRDAAQAKKVSEKRSEAAKSRWSDAKADAKPMQNALQIEPVCNAEREREKERDLSTVAAAAPPKNDHAAEFEEWYSAYPKKEAKKAAKTAFIKARKTVDMQTLLDGLAKYKDATRSKERQFLANPATWLNAGRWDDVYETGSANHAVPNAYRMFN